MTDDQDPTGMSHLLAGLKETGPMPDDLNDRIRASLADEQAARAAEDADPPEEIEDDDASERSTFWAGMDTDESRPRRRTSTAGRWVLGIAAGAVVAMGIGGIFAVRGGDEDAASDSAGGQETSRENSEGSAAADSTPSETPAFAVTESGTTYTRADLASQAGALYADPGEGGELEDTSVLGTMSTAAGAKDCLSRLGSPDLQPVVIDVARFGDTPGVLIIAEPMPDGTPKAWAVTTGCEQIWDGPADIDAGD